MRPWLEKISTERQSLFLQINLVVKDKVTHHFILFHFGACQASLTERYEVENGLRAVYSGLDFLISSTPEKFCCTQSVSLSQIC